MKLSLSRTAVIASVIAVAFTGCLQESGITSSHASSGPTAAAAVTQAALVAPSARVALPDFSGLVEQVGPAVVNISVTSVDRSRPTAQLDENDPFFDFFRRFGVPIPGTPNGGGGQAQPRISQGIGSGFIVSTDGYILTNAHVVDNATEVTVKLTDKREFKAKVIGADKRTDVALIKIEGKDLPTLRMGEPDKAKVGEWVVAVGSPFGFDNTVTAGIISAKSRKLPDETYVPFIQTDVAINPGNSGGPLFNLNGEVIGINSQIYSRSGGFMGISFAIPIDVALKVKDQLQKHGKVSRGKLGVVIQGMDKDMAQAFGLDKPAGALVNSVEQGGPADKAGLQQGDIITHVDGTKVEESGDLPRVIGEHHPGDMVKLKVWRDKSSRDLSVKLGEQSTEKVALEKNPGADSGGKIGLTVRPLNAREAKQLGLNGGLVIEDASGAAAKAGLQQGDVILAVSNQKVTSVEQLRKLVDAAGNRVPLLIQRGENQMYVVVKPN